MNRLFLFVAVVFLFRATCFSLADFGQTPNDIVIPFQISEWSSLLTIIALWWSHHVYNKHQKE